MPSTHTVIRKLHLGDEVIMVSQVCTAVDTAVAAVAGVQVRLERFGFSQFHHGYKKIKDKQTDHRSNCIPD